MDMEEKLKHLEEGQSNYLILGSFEEEITSRIGDDIHSHVMLSPESYRHIKQRHPELEKIDYEMLPDAVRVGLVIKDSKRDSVVVSFQSPFAGRRLAVPINVTSKGELYCRTVFRTRQRFTRQLMERGEVLRRHK